MQLDNKKKNENADNKRIDFALRNEPNTSTSVANDTVTFQETLHFNVNALNEVKEE